MRYLVKVGVANERHNGHGFLFLLHLLVVQEGHLHGIGNAGRHALVVATAIRDGECRVWLASMSCAMNDPKN